MSIPESSPWSWSWVRTPFWRIFGSFASWFLFSLCMMLLLQSFLGLAAIGGACADGGAYEIETHCPDAVALFMPLSVFGGLASVVIAVLFGQGFGTTLTDLAWPILFGSLGGGFLAAFFATGDGVGLILGGMFEIMALVPLALVLRASAQRVFLGAVNVRGERFYEGENPRSTFIGIQYPRASVTVPATGGDWALSIAVLSGAIALGYVAAVAAYASV